MKNPKKKFVFKDNLPLNLDKNYCIHLSSQFNATIKFDWNGEEITSNRDIDELLYVNIPNYKNVKKNSYQREEYTNNNK